VLGIALALASSLTWGISDFLGGIQTRRFSALSVLLVAQPVGLVLGLAAALTFGGTPLSREDFVLAALAGIAVAAALGVFYRAMALGSISVVTTIGALGVLVPITVGLARGETPEGIQAVGAAIVLPAVVVVAHDPDPEWRKASRQSVGLAALAALGFGVFLLIIDDVAGTDPIWTIVAVRVGGVAAILAAALVARPGLPPLQGTVLTALIGIGVFDVLANTFYAAATNHGILPLIAVASSMYAVVTVLLARVVLGERLARSQQIGFAFAIAGTAMIAAGA
jgi:drug/metabolite transporter (DMT)-like permease